LDHEGTTVPSLNKNEGRATILASLGTVHTLGLPVNWQTLYPGGGNHVRLPAYPWQRERFWLDFSDGGTVRSNGKGHLLGQHLQPANATGSHFWEIELSTQLFRYLNDHRVQGAVVFPAAAYVEMALAAATEALGKGPYVLENLEFKRALFVPERGRERVQLIISPQLVGDASFELHSLQATEGNGSGSWLLNAKGNVRPAHSLEARSERQPLTPQQLMARCPETFDAADFYPAMSARGLQYGPAFQGVQRIWRREGEALGKLLLTEAVQAESTAYEVHPALLDACFQVLAGTLSADNGQQVKEGVYLPVGLRKFRLYRQPGSELWVHAQFRPEDDGHGNGDGDADVLTGDLYLLDENGDVVLEALGFRVQRVERTTAPEAEEKLDDWLYTIEWEEQALPEAEVEQPAAEQAGSWIIFADRGGVAHELQRLLEERGASCTVVTPAGQFQNMGNGHYGLNPGQAEEFERLFSELAAEQPPYRGIIHLWSLDIEPPQETTLASLESARRQGSISVLHTVQALAKTGLSPAPQLWLVTAGSQALEENTAVSMAQAPVWGLGKVISFEHPELRCKKIDLGGTQPTAEVESLFRELWAEMRAESEEDQVALRGEQRFVPRLKRAEPPVADRTVRVSPQEQAFRLEIPTPGILDNFILRATERRPPAEGEVEIQVRAVGMNFRDVMIAMDLLPPVFEGSLDVGFECAGVITAVGEGVESLQPGDEVVAGAPACFGSYVTAPASMVSAKPPHLTFEEAATIPIAFLTAYYALVYLGRLRKGERVLIHAASGGVGQAAVQIAQHVGAEIFATAGSDEKRAFLKAQGIEHVMNSRTLEFADEVMRITGGEGVDIVLNSLAGEFIPKGIATLRAGGRFLEIGKVDILQNSQLGLQLLDNNIAFFAIDLSKLIKNEQQWMTLLWNEAMAFFADYKLQPLPLERFPISNVVEAFRHMAQARHIGKVVISMEEEEVDVTRAADEVSFDPEATYLITGGAGGLGLSVARWMVERGARHLALLGRSGAREAAQELIGELENMGAQIELLRGDVSHEEQVAQLLDHVRQTMPPLKGIIHSAGVLDDGILLQQTPERFRKVMAPKVEGAWNLHTLTQGDLLDYFVLFSSGASVLGSPGQANYVAANAFLDGLAHQRRALGLPATAINWGAWAEVGLATRADRVQHLTQQGIVPFSPQQGVELLGRILSRQETQMMAVRMEWSNLVRLYSPPFLTYLAEEATAAGPAGSQEAGQLREKLLAAKPEKRQQVAEEFLKEQMAKVLRSAPEKIDIHQPLTSLGIDSLMAVELKNRVETEFAISVPVTALLQGPTLSQLATIVLEQLTEEEPAPEAGPAPSQAEEELLATIDQLSDEEVDHLLEELLDEEGHETTHSA
jgi:NADPH:quinone reductase-like Zn-dependent oxidoreductase/acyl carrier protein